MKSIVFLFFDQMDFTLVRKTSWYKCIHSFRNNKKSFGGRSCFNLMNTEK